VEILDFLRQLEQEQQDTDKRLQQKRYECEIGLKKLDFQLREAESENAQIRELSKNYDFYVFAVRKGQREARVKKGLYEDDFNNLTEELKTVLNKLEMTETLMHSKCREIERIKEEQERLLRP